MNTVLAVLSLVAVAVSAGPFDFKAPDNTKLVTHHAVRHEFDHDGGKKHLGFLYLVPRVDSGLHKDGFKSASKGPHGFLVEGLDDKHGLVDLLGLSDCETWHAAHLTLWHPDKGLEHRVHGYVKNGESFEDQKLGDFEKFVAFVTEKAPKDGFGGLLGKGLPAHHVTFRLHKWHTGA